MGGEQLALGTMALWAPNILGMISSTAAPRRAEGGEDRCLANPPPEFGRMSGAEGRRGKAVEGEEIGCADARCGLEARSRGAGRRWSTWESPGSGDGAEVSGGRDGGGRGRAASEAVVRECDPGGQSEPAGDDGAQGVGGRRGGEVKVTGGEAVWEGMHGAGAPPVSSARSLRFLPRASPPGFWVLPSLQMTHRCVSLALTSYLGSVYSVFPSVYHASELPPCLRLSVSQTELVFFPPNPCPCVTAPSLSSQSPGLYTTLASSSSLVLCPPSSPVWILVNSFVRNSSRLRAPPLNLQS